MSDPARIATFTAAYTAALITAVKEHPEEYPWANEDTVIHGNVRQSVIQRVTVDTVVTRMLAAVQSGGFSHEGRAFKATCKTLGIKHTQKAIRGYINGQ